MAQPNPWIFEPDQNRIVSDTTSVGLTPKTAAVLACLMRRNGQTLSPDQILAEVWKDVHVTPDLVREYISDLRRILGDDARAPVYIETVRGKGFRLIGPVTLTSQDLPFETRLPRVSVARPKTLGGPTTWQVFVDQLGEEVILNLARFSDLAVIARESSYKDKRLDDAAELQTPTDSDYTLDLRAYADSMSNTIYAKLVSNADLHVLWTERFDLKDDDLPAVPSNIAAQVANALAAMNGAILRSMASLGPSRETSSFEAFRLYALACECEDSFTAGQDEKAQLYISEAIERDPGFARSHLIKGYLYAQSAYRRAEHSPEVWHAKALDAFDQAYALDKDDPMILGSVALGKSSSGDIARARVLAHRAIDRSWNNADAAVVASSAATLILGDTATAAALLKTARALNPNAPGWYGFYEARTAFFREDFEQAIDLAATSAPFLTAFVFQYFAEVMLGRVEEAHETHRALMKGYPKFASDTYRVQIGLSDPKFLDLYSTASRAAAQLA